MRLKKQGRECVSKNGEVKNPVILPSIRKIENGPTTTQNPVRSNFGTNLGFAQQFWDSGKNWMLQQPKEYLKKNVKSCSQ